MSNKEKKPFYKRTWFIVLVVIVILSAIGSMSGNNDNKSKKTNESASTSQSNSQDNNATNDTKDTETKKEEKKDEAIKAGTYKIGTDLDEGEYVIVSTGFSCYAECSSDSTGDLESIIFNDNVDGNIYATVHNGEYLKVTGGKIYPVDKAPSLVPEDGLYKDGMYKVGKDIPAGEYKVVLEKTATGMGYYEVSSDSTHQLTSIVTNENVQADTYLTISDGQYIKLNGVSIQK